MVALRPHRDLDDRVPVGVEVVLSHCAVRHAIRVNDLDAGAQRLAIRQVECHLILFRIDLEANLRGEMHALNSSLLRTLFFGMVGTNATLVGLVFAAVRLA